MRGEGEHEGDSDDFDSFFLGQDDMDALDALEARPSESSKPVSRSNAQSKAISVDDNDYDDDCDDLLLDGSDDWDDPELLNQVLEVESLYAQQGGNGSASTHIAGASVKPAPAAHRQAVAGPSSRRGNGSAANNNFASGSGARQRNLFGEVLPMQASQGMLLKATKAHTATGTASQRVRDALTNKNHRFQMESKAKRKEWDRSQPLVVKKSNTSSFHDDDDDFDDEIENGRWSNDDDAFTSAPPPIEPEGLKQMKIPIDRKAAETWVYPTNKEKRDYQYNIVQRALFNNVLVALPTGLGKTLIAAVVILNYYRWFPTGKIIFVAPTKPLVVQQQQACHGICGLPWDCAVRMTGENKASLRGDEWKSKRIFYMTPQTFENDLCTTAVDAEDVVCVVVDEAHRATGNYAYGKVIKWITRRNPFFRVLALTATPGNRPEKVQEVIDNLHINLIEIRTEEAVDIRKYVHSKSEDTVVVPMGGVVKEIFDLFAKLMQPLIEKLKTNGLLDITDPLFVAPFAVMQIYKNPVKKNIINQRKLYHAVADIRKMAEALEYLIRYSVEIFYEKFTSLQTGSDDKGKKVATNRQKEKYQNNTIIREIQKLYEEAQDEKGKVRHPKMEYLQNVVAAHFTAEEERGRKEDTRVMVFCQYRQCVCEIVDLLNEQNGIEATRFVGKSSDKNGNKGMPQGEQESIIKDFKTGKINVLVATSIGEEGLDIGEVDLIVCYEAVKNSVRMLQRVGRTGRKRDGRIVVLMSEGPEERNWQYSKDNHRNIQEDLINGSHLELFDDVERLVPEDITSTCVLQDVDQPEFEPSLINAPTRQKKIPKPKRNSDPLRNIPKNGLKGFVKVSDMKRKKGRQSLREGESSDDHSSEKAESSSSSSSIEDVAPAMSNTKTAYTAAAALCDDSDDDLEDGRLIFQRRKNELIKKAVELPNIPSSVRKTGRLGMGRPVVRLTPQHSSTSHGSASSQVQINLLSSSPTFAVEGVKGNIVDSPLQTSRVNVQGRPEQSNEGKKSKVQKTQEQFSTPSSPVKPPKRFRRVHPLVAKLAAELHDSDEEEDLQDEVQKGIQESKGDNESVENVPLESPAVSKKRRTRFRRKDVMQKKPSSSPPNGLIVKEMAAPSKKSKGKRRSREEDEDEKGAKHGESANISSKTKPRKKRVIGGSPTSRRLFQYEADRSTDEEIHGEKDENDDGQDSQEADSSDLEHVGDFAPTQAPRGYKQQAIYLQSLHSQANLTPFKQRSKGVIPGYQMGIDSEQVRRYVQDTPRRRDSGGGIADEEDDNHYERDSFVCSDEDIVFDSEPQSSLL